MSTRTSSIEELRGAFGELMAAERRLRGRDPARGELSHVELRALFRLAAEEEMTAGALAKCAEVTPASITAMLDRLEERGIVRRRRSERDRRQVIVSLTAAGHDLLEAKRTAWEERWARELAAHSEEELDAAIGVIRSLVGLLDGVGR
jgi:DNA-binding MarR family transcriptional regulator